MRRCLKALFSYIKRAFICIFYFLLSNFSYFGLLNWLIFNNKEARNILQKNHPDIIGENDIETTESLFLLKSSTITENINDFDLDYFALSFYNYMFFLYKPLVGILLRIFNYKLNYKHNIIPVSYNSIFSCFKIIIFWIIGFSIIFISALAISN